MTDFQRGYWDAQMCIAHSIMIAAELHEGLPPELTKRVTAARMAIQKCIDTISPGRPRIGPKDISNN